MKKRIIAMLLAVMTMLALVGCGGGIEGTWTATQDGVTMEYTFEKDGKGSVSVSGMTLDTTWKTDGDKLKLTMSMLGQSQTQEYTYKVDGDKLTLTLDGDTVELKRK